MKNQKGISSLIIVIIIGIIAIGGVLAYQYLWTPEEKVEEEAETLIDETAEEEPYVEVISPNGGEKWEVGETHFIKWSTVGSISNDIYISLVVSMEGIATPCSFIIVKLTDGESNTGSYSWKIPSEYSPDMGMCGPTETAGKNKIMVSSRDTSGRIVLSDESDNYFTIVKD